jgi:SAM-dependent methyltransferase
MGTPDNKQFLYEEIVRLGPWHLEVQVTPEVSTRVSLEVPAGTYSESYGSIPFTSPRAFFHGLLKSVYPLGLENRRVLDCACNCGGWLFWAKEMGAGECFGFDVRGHWIAQALFLAENRTEPSQGIHFDVCDLYTLPGLRLGAFDITIFNGIFYHLPDPITGLKIAADLTTELIMVNTATRNGLSDGLLSISTESSHDVISGTYGLAWLPTGPNVLTQILRWLGFVEIRCAFWYKNISDQPPEFGRLQLLASRKAGLFEHFDSHWPST